MSPSTKAAAVLMVLITTAAGGYLTYSRLAPEPPRPLQPAAVDQLPDFTLADLEGEPRSIRSWADNRGLVINFWATWCAPCLREIPLLIALQADDADPAVQVIGIAVDRLDDVTAFAPEMNFNYPILIGQSDAMEAAQTFGIEFLALPFTVFAAPFGQILAVHTGEITRGDLDNYTAVLADLSGGTISLPAARQRMAGRF